MGYNTQDVEIVKERYKKKTKEIMRLRKIQNAAEILIKIASNEYMVWYGHGMVWPWYYMVAYYYLNTILQLKR